MRAAIDETARRREKQIAYNLEHGITPQTIKKKISDLLTDVFGESPSKDTKGKKPAAQMPLPKNAQDLQAQIKKLQSQMREAAGNLEFEEAARIRDIIKRLESLDLELISIV